MADQYQDINAARAVVNQVAAMLGGGPGRSMSYAEYLENKKPQGKTQQAAEPGTKPKEPEHETTEQRQPAQDGPRRKAKATWSTLLAQLKELNAKANAGDQQALEELRHLLDKYPEVSRHIGNLAKIAESSWLDLLVEGDALGREATKRQLASLKANLAGEHPTPLEQMLVDNITVAYLAQRHAEIHEAGDVGGSLQQAAYRLKRSESAQRRYLAAIKTLSTLRAKVPAGLAPLKGLKLHDPGQKVG